MECEQPPMTIEDVAIWIEARIEGLYFQQMQGEGQAQVVSIQRAGSQSAGKTTGELPWSDLTAQHFQDGDVVSVDFQFVSSAMLQDLQPRLSEEDFKELRAALRFNLNDRVLCNCGSRWLSGLIVGTAVIDGGEFLPYLVKTDPLPGAPSRTISVPSDNDAICTQEVCFDPSSQLHLVQAAAQHVKESARPKLRFAAGESVVVRLRNDPADRLEKWVPGKISSIWPRVGGARKWQLDTVSGEFPDVVPYMVALASGGWVFCHRDHFTLIRREGLQPKTRGTGISKRMEIVIAADGSREQIDHLTERRKSLQHNNIGGDDSDDSD